MENKNSTKTQPSSASRPYLLRYIQTAPEQEPQQQQLDTWALFYIVHGFGYCKAGNKVIPFTKDDVLLIPPKVPHWWYYEPLATDIYGNVCFIKITFTQELLDGYISTIPEMRTALEGIALPKKAIRYHGDSEVKIRQQVLDMEMLDEPELQEQMKRLLLLLFTEREIIRKGRLNYSNRNSERLRQIMKFLEQRYKQIILLDDIAREVNMHMYSFCIYFKKNKGISFSNYVILYRIDVACKLLRTTPLRITEIAASTGFLNVSHFGTTFKNVMGITPSTYRIYTRCNRLDVVDLGIANPMPV